MSENRKLDSTISVVYAVLKGDKVMALYSSQGAAEEYCRKVPTTRWVVMQVQSEYLP